jgi:tellurite resistance protein
MSDAYEIHDDNSPQVVLRIALAVALGDALLDKDEREKLQEVYLDIRDEMGDERCGGSADEDVEAITAEVMDQLAQSDEAEDHAQLYEMWASSVTDHDLQEIALLSALRVAGAGHDYDSDEAAALKEFCELWGLELAAILEPFTRH